MLGTIGAAAALFTMLPSAGYAQSSSVVGSYVCRSMGPTRCDTNSALNLLANGHWGWGGYAGLYQVSGNAVEFTHGDGGPVTWGSALIGSKGTLVFSGGNGQLIVWQKPTVASSSSVRAGSYRCQTAPGGCLTHDPVVLDGNGAWTWGASGGSYDVVGSQVLFHGPTSGPPGWGAADVGGGTLTWRTSSGSSTWSL